tara:strand:+ start:572 stop:823 length:252 start_codon:yes stop_codon:yes gene_type:complete
MNTYDISESTLKKLLSKRRFKIHSLNFNIGIMDTCYPIEESIALIQEDMGVSYTLDKNILSATIITGNGSSDIQKLLLQIHFT